MRKIAAVLFSSLALALAPSLARADEPASGSEPPSKGTGMIVGGAVFTGLGVVNLATSPICLTSTFETSNTKTLCLGLSLGLGIGFTLIGVPLLVAGASRRSRYLEWKQSHGALQTLTDIGFAPAPGGGMLTWRTAL
jgi:hypothetical protein